MQPIQEDAPAADRVRPEGSVAERMEHYVGALQARICDALEALDGVGTFQSDPWQRPGGGGGLSRVIEDGAVFEKGGVNVSAVHGALPERMARAFGVDTAPFFATGLSLVLHPRSPYIPTVHANVRYFALGEDLLAPDDQWFGGGADLTPYYPTIDDARHFHRVWKAACDRHPEVADYEAFKKACDEYFFLPHRNEARGVGGIFFDYIREEPDATFRFVSDIGDRFLEAYGPLVERWMDRPFGRRERSYQALRRGRYAEFNLLFDRGTRFGIETSGRTESILMSLPPCVQWRYDWVPEPGTPEAESAWFFQARDWLAL